MTDTVSDFNAALELAAEFSKTIDAARFLRNELGITLTQAVAATENAAIRFPQSPLAVARRMGG